MFTMGPSLLHLAVTSLVCLSGFAMSQIRFPGELGSSSSSSGCGGADSWFTRLDKITMVQNMYVQYQEFAATIPVLNSFSTCFWLSVMEPDRIATILNYGLDPAVNNDNMTIQYQPAENAWTLVINSKRVYTAKTPLLPANTWTHICQSWDGRTGQWSLWQNGLLLDSGVNQESIGVSVPGGGMMVTAQHQNTLFNGMDAGAGMKGSITLLHVDTASLGSPHNGNGKWAVRQFYGDCSAKDRGDLISWVRTPRRGYGGVTSERAREACGRF